MRKYKFPVLIILGVGLVIISLVLIGFSQISGYVGSVNGKETVAKMEELLPYRSAGVPLTYSNSNPNMPILEIDGTDYVAMLEIPTLDVKLPVADKWDSGKLYKASARFYGSCYDNSIVIGGTDSSYQFSFCEKIENGTTITVTDMTGAEFSYTVTQVDRSKKAHNEWLTNEDYDLTLFCQNTYGMEYIAVRCVSAKS